MCTGCQAQFCKKQKPPAAIAAGAKIADSDFDFFLDRVFRERKRSGPSLCEQAGEDGHQTAAEDARDPAEHIARDGLMQHQKRQQRRERGLEEEHERRCLRARDLHGQEVAREADAGHADVDEEHDRQIRQRVAGEEGDARKRVQSCGRQAGGEGWDVR